MHCAYCRAEIKSKKGKIYYEYQNNIYCKLKCVYGKEGIGEWNKYDQSVIKPKVKRIVQ